MSRLLLTSSPTRALMTFRFAAGETLREACEPISVPIREMSSVNYCYVSCGFNWRSRKDLVTSLKANCQSRLYRS